MTQYKQIDNIGQNTISPKAMTIRPKRCIYVALGGNYHFELCNVVTKIGMALSDFVCAGIKIRSMSRFFSTPCFPAGAGPDFVNAVVSVSWQGDADSLMHRLHALEARHGRERTQRWGQRTLDLDLIAMGTTVLPDLKEFSHWRDLALDRQIIESPAKLILPHPRLQDRAFVLVPLADIAADWCHPVSGVSVRRMVDALPPSDVEAVRPL